MSVQDGEKVNASVTNGAFVSKEVDDTKIGLLNLQDPSSANVDDVQGTINQNKTDIADHETRISQNETDIADHETRISTNETEIQAIEDSVGAPNGIAQLDGSGRLPSSQLTLDAVQYKGTWNASTNTPTLIDGTGTQGDFYVVTVAGSQDLGSGSQTFNINDRVFYNGSIWEQVDHTDAVSSVFGRTGSVTAQASDYDANQVDFDNTASGIAATNVQDAIDNVEGRVDSLEGASYVNSFEGRTGAVTAAFGDYGANQVTYQNTTSGLTATDTQGAIDEVEGRVDTLEGASYVNTFAGRSGTVLPAASDYDAIQIDFNNTASGSSQTEVQGFLDELDGRVDTLEAAPSGVTSFEGRTGAVVSASGDYDASEITETTTKKFDIKHNRSAIVDPTTSDDSTAEYQIGSHWFNSVSGTEFVCQDNTATAAVWIVASGSGGVGSPSIFGVLDAESSNPLDNWTTSAGTLSEETTSQLNGDVSYKYAPTAASDETESPAIVIPLRAKDKITVMTEFVYNATHDGFRAEIRDNAANAIATLDLPASETSARMIYNLTGSETSLNFAIVDATHTASMEIVFDDVVFDDEPFRKIDTIEINSVSLEGNDGRTITGASEDISWNGTGTGWTGGADGQPSYYTVQKNDSVIQIKGQVYTSADNQEALLIYLNGSSYRNVNNRKAAGLSQLTTFDYVSTKGEFSVGDQISIRFATTQTLNTLLASRHYLNINEQYTNESVVVENADGSEWTAYTPITQGIGTPTIYDLKYKRDGGDLLIVGRLDNGTVTADEFQFGLPNGLAVSSDVVGVRYVGEWHRVTTSGSHFVLLATAGDTYLNMSYRDGGFGATTTPQNGSAMLGTGEQQMFSARVPIEGWSATEAHIIPIADPYENHYSARILNSGSASVDVESVSGTFSPTWNSTGTVTVDYSSLGLTSKPIVTVVGEGQDVQIATAATATSVQIVTYQSATATVTDANFNISIQKTGADYKEPRGYFLGEVATDKMVEMVLTANVTTTGDVADFARTDLTVGKIYTVKGKLASDSGSNFKADFLNGATKISHVQNNGGGAQSKDISFDFEATSTDFDLNVTAASGTDRIKGNSTKDESGSFLQITESNTIRKVGSF